jgi:hypothetical protein
MERDWHKEQGSNCGAAPRTEKDGDFWQQAN